MSWAARIGLAVVHPRWALVGAGDRRHAGRSGSDLLLLVALFLVATQLRFLFVSAWVGLRRGATQGLHQFGGVLTDSLTLVFAFLVLAAIAVFALAGRKREIGRSFDLACVAAVPLVLVSLVATALVRGLDLGVPVPLQIILLAVSFGWGGALTLLAVPVARVGSGKQVADAPAPIAGLGRRAGLAVVVVSVIGAAAQVRYIATHYEDLRPMTPGDFAPTMALHRIEANGKLGQTVSLDGRPAVLDFWATWCKPCLASMPGLDAFTRHHPEIAVLSINLDDPAAARRIFDERHYAMTLVADDGETADRYGVSSIPNMVFIDRDGNIRDMVEGGGADLEAIAGNLSK